MGKKNVHSQDPRKKILVAAFKRRFDCTKVTCLVELEQGARFQADCLRPAGNGKFEALRGQVLRAEEVSQLTGTGR